MMTENETQISADHVLVLVPDQYGGLRVCSACDLALALLTAEDDDSLEDAVESACIDGSVHMRWDASEAERLAHKVMLHNRGGDYWKELDE
jgi:hypothetical protein